MLEFDAHVPDGVAEGAPLIVLLHGRGSHKGDLMGLQPHLPSEAVVVAPQAPYSGAELGYGGGWAWYHFLGRNRPHPEQFEKSQRDLHRFLHALPDRLGISPGPLVLGGFSQGATMSTAYALRHPGQVALNLHFSGFLADHPSVQPTPMTVAGTAFFWGHGVQDPVIPFALAEEGRQKLREAGADLEARDYPIGHWIDPTELQDALRWLEARLVPASGEGSSSPKGDQG